MSIADNTDLRRGDRLVPTRLNTIEAICKSDGISRGLAAYRGDVMVHQVLSSLLLILAAHGLAPAGSAR